MSAPDPAQTPPAEPADFSWCNHDYGVGVECYLCGHFNPQRADLAGDTPCAAEFQVHEVAETIENFTRRDRPPRAAGFTDEEWDRHCGMIASTAESFRAALIRGYDKWNHQRADLAGDTGPAAHEVPHPLAEGTLFKVKQALMIAGLTVAQAHDAIAEMQNAGILFRERGP